MRPLSLLCWLPLLLQPAFSQSAQNTQSQLAHHAQQAQVYLTQHQPLKAIPELQAVVALEPNNVEARANLGVLLFFQGQFPSAIPQLRAALAINPNLTKIQSLLGIAERRTGDDRAGRADLEAVFPLIEDKKLKTDVGQDLIASYTSSGDLDRAATVIAALLKLDPTNSALLYTSYRLHADLAVEALLALGLAAPDSAQTHQAMAHELQRDRDLPGTITNLRKALALDPDLPGIHFELAEALHASDDQRLRTEAFQQYKLAVQTGPDDPKAATRLGDLEVEQGDLTSASTHYNQALKLQPGNADAAIGQGNILAQKGDAAAAATMLEQVEAADPTNSLVHFRLSTVYRKLNRPDDVKRELAAYQRYKDEREKLRLVYQQMRVASPQDESPKPQ
jgi:tetratricopeptide (TPR) repeat protein